MNSRQLLAANKLAEAVQALSAEVRDNPTDAQRRTILFELLSFNGEWERAEKQLTFLGKDSGQAGLGAAMYLAALHADKTRHDLFRSGNLPQAEAPAVSGGTINGKPFQTLADADPRIGPRLEVYAAGAYLWIPFAHITRIETEAPKRLRDTLWFPALVRTGPAFRDQELGEVLLPVLAPFSHQHPDGAVRLGRMTVDEETEDGLIVPKGQKMLLVDGEEIPLLEVRSLEIHPAGEDVTVH